MSNGTTTWTYTYGADGLRTKRTNGTDTYTYVYNGSYLTVMTKGDDTLQFTYDASGTPLAVNYNGTTYYYKTNLQGDIIAIANISGTAVVSYAYNAWGVLLSCTGTMADSLGAVNPLRYRGYVYDTETALYYLQSRYYNPEWGRFINADAFASTGQGLLGNNMFAYCINNPINLIDPAGYFPIWILFYKSSFDSSVNGNSVVEGVAGTSSSAITIANVASAKKSLPPKGEPNSNQTLHNPDGTPKQKRWYGPNGDAVRDRDYNHAGKLPFPHDHEWKNGEKQRDHLPPSPDYEFSGDVILGVGITVVCVVGIGWVALNDISGVGALDDASLIPLSENLTRGINMIFKVW